MRRKNSTTDTTGHPDFPVLDGDAIRRAFTDGVAHRIASLEIVEQVGSTNDRLLYEVDASASGFCVCLAESQTAGRGRRGRKVWYSPKNGNLYLSVLRRSPTATPRPSAWLALTAAVEVTSALAADQGVGGLGVKWPNDIYCNGRKLGGVLVESKGDRCVVGLGLNVCLPADGGSASEIAWTALDEIRPCGLDRQQLVASMIVAIVRAFDRVEHDCAATLIENWRRHDLLAGREVAVLAGGKALAGIARGVDEHGGLRVEHKNCGGDGLRVYYANDVSLRQ